MCLNKATILILFRHIYMTREEKCLLAIERGVTYDPETGIIYGSKGEKITSKHKDGYIVKGLKIDYKRYALLGHHFAWYWVHKECVEFIDHINGIRDDNRICNLRKVTRQGNNFNKTTAKGYCWDKSRNKWSTHIMLNYKNIYLGRFDTEEEARNAYLEAKKIYHII